MAVIVEILGWGGRCRRYFTVHSQTVTIGRAYDNDVVVDDVHVSPHHMRLEREYGGWRALDLHSLNGVQVVKNPGNSKELLASGAEIKIGRTRLRLVAMDQKIEDAKPLHLLDRGVIKLGSPTVWIPLLLLMLLAEISSLYLHSITRWEWKNVFYTLINRQLPIFFMAAIWSVVGRVVRHESHFFCQLSLIVLYALLYKFGGWVLRVAGYNLGSPLFPDIVTPSAGLIMLWLMLSANLAVATNLTMRSRWMVAGGIAFLMLVIALAESMQQWGEFSSFPRYFGELEPPPMLFVPGEKPETFLNGLDEVFLDANALAREPLN